MDRLLIDMTGQRCNSWTVIARAADRNSRWRTYWRCQCQCGNVRDVEGLKLRKGYTKSCGCLQASGKHRNGKNRPHARTHVARQEREVGHVGPNVRLDAFSADPSAREEWLARMELVGRLITWKHSVRYASYG